ncbi:MAG: site-specific DNA-methyltransferase, partial [Chloroflexota bacterium]|nr:site-specific DNA-methyltransferase [Chloroflexota bacterium]
MPTLDFKGKQHIYAHHLTVPHRPLVVDEARSVLPDTDPQSIGGKPADEIPFSDQNLIIHGDNLHALKALLPHYAGRVKCIYIDPPYNTGNEGWVYNDNVNSPMLRDWFEKNSPVDGEDLERHDKWLCMMWPRLHLLRELLRDDGVIFVSIDDNEVHHLRMMMDEIFGEENFVAQIVWHSKYTQANDARYLSRQHESILFFAKDKNALPKLRISRPENMNKSYSNPDNDPRGPWKSTPLHAKSGSGNYKYTFANGYTWQAPSGRYPRYAENRLSELELDNRITFGKEGRGTPNVKTFLRELDMGVVSASVWKYQDVGHTHGANEEFASVLGKGVFDNPKPTGLIQRMLELSTWDQPNPTPANPPPPPQPPPRHSTPQNHAPPPLAPPD